MAQKKQESQKKSAQPDSQPQMSKEQQIGYHFGSLDVLKKEHEEMSRITAIVEQLIQLHTKALTDLGVTTNTSENNSEKKESKPKQKIPIEHLI